jgi:hypothetical protein
MQFDRLRYCFGSGLRLAYNFDFGDLRQHPAKAFAERRVVVHN